MLQLAPAAAMVGSAAARTGLTGFVAAQQNN